MKMQYEAKLIRAKLRSYRIRTTLVVLVSSILFALLATGSIVYRGVILSIDDFRDEGHHRSYMVAASYMTLQSGLSKNLTLIDRAEQIQEQLIEEKKQLAKKYDVPYDESQEPPIALEEENNGKKTKSLNWRAPAVIKAIQERNQRLFAKHVPQLYDLAKEYNAVNTFPIRYMSAKDGAIAFPTNGKELLLQKPDPDNPHASLSLHGGSVTTRIGITDDKLLAPFLLKNADLTSTDSIPLVVAYNDAERLLKLEPLKKDANPEMYVKRMKEIQDAAIGTTFTACYRNNASIQLVQQSQKDEKRQLEQANIAYKTPTTACAATTIAKDERTDKDRAREDAVGNYNRELGIDDTPVQKTVSYRIIGLFPYANNTQGPSEKSHDLIKAVLTSGGGGGPTIPTSLYDIPEVKKYVDRHYGKAQDMSAIFESRNFILTFNTLATAKRMIETESCKTNSSGICEGKTPFSLTLTGNNDAAVTDAFAAINRTIIYAALAISGLAIIFMSILLGKIISDSRRETAVLRAIGYSRRNIASIYTVYTLHVSLIIAALSIGLGIAGAYGIASIYTQQVTDFALYSVGAVDLTRTAQLMDIQLLDMLMLAGLIVTTGLISVIVPLLRNVRRNPINDLREA